MMKCCFKRLLTTFLNLLSTLMKYHLKTLLRKSPLQYQYQYNLQLNPPGILKLINLINAWTSLALSGLAVSPLVQQMETVAYGKLKNCISFITNYNSSSCFHSSIIYLLGPYWTKLTMMEQRIIQSMRSMKM